MKYNNIEAYSDKTIMTVFRNRARNFAVITFFLLIIFTVTALFLVKHTNIFAEKDPFSVKENQQFNLAKVSDAKLEDNPFKLDVSNVIVEGNYIKLTISGVNLTESIWTPKHDNFILTGNNITQYESRSNYYPSNFTTDIVGSGESFSYNLSFYVDNANKNILKNYVYTLTAFVNYDYTMAEFEVDEFIVK